MHLNNAEKKFLVNSNKEELGKEYRVHGKMGLLFFNNFKVSPSFILFKYGALFGGKEWQVRPAIDMLLLQKWMIGTGMRISNFAERGNNIDAVVFTLKWKPHVKTGNKKSRRDNMIVGLSFDLNVSRHQVRASRRYGAFEVFATRYFTGRKNTSPCCPWSNTENQAFY